MFEIWKDIPGYEGVYAVSNYGSVKSYVRRRIMPNGGILIYPEKIKKPRKDTKGYLIVDLWKDGKQKTIIVHRLVAMAFIPNPDNLPFVCHKDDNRVNNCLDNLFWGTQKDNLKDMASKNRQHIKKRPVVAMLSDRSKEYEFESQMEASRQTRISQRNIWSCLNGRRKSAGGLIWQYANN